MRDPSELVGKNVVTSFVKLTERYFADLEAKTNGNAGLSNGDASKESGKTRAQDHGRLRTKIKYVGGSVEAACALGVADGIVDLVGMLCSSCPRLDPYRLVSRPALTSHCVS